MYVNILTALCLILIIFLLIMSISNPTMTSIIVILFIGILAFGFLSMRDQYRKSSSIQ